MAVDLLQQFVKWEAELQERKHERNDRIAKLSPAAKEAYDRWMALRKNERVFLNTLTTDIRTELKLVCGFCGSHTHGSGPGDKEHGSGESATTFSPTTPESSTEIPKEDSDKLFKFHDDSLDAFLRKSEDILMNEDECNAYIL
uniref:Uncharacterized protein n=1 Tax=Panagrolaimus sp. ES5 TaxID=591445 RepID=A0AC34FMI6_9BILA